MPYLSPELRQLLESGELAPETTGDLNYCLSLIVNEYAKINGKSYETLSSAVAALLDCRDEFYRKVVAPYEDEKIKANGDVFTV